MKKNSKIVTLGGGTGNFVVLSALKNYFDNLSAVVSMADDGGSTGILRDELGVLPPGDVRQCLVALSQSSKLMRDLFNYRFDEGSLAGHSFGNLFLTALEKTTGDFNEAVKKAGEILNISGRVIPITTDNINLCVQLEDGRIIKGQNKIDEFDFAKNKAVKFFIKPNSYVNLEAQKAILDAELIIITPGNLYSSIIPIFLVKEASKILQRSKAVKICICNLVTKQGQTDKFTVSGFVSEIEKYIGGNFFDYVIYNNKKPDSSILKKYAKVGEEQVKFNLGEFEKQHYVALGCDLISRKVKKQDKSDKLIQRNLIRHNQEKLAKKILEIYEKK